MPIVLGAPVTDEATRREFFAMLAVAGLLVGCAGEEDEAAGPAPTPATRSVTHFFGATEAPVAPERIVVVAEPVLGNLLALGMTVAATVEPTISGSLDYLGERLEAIAKLGTRSPLNLEAVAALDPDLIFTAGAEFARELYDSVREIAPTVAPTYGYATIEEVRTFLIECGVCAGREQKARALAAALDARIEELRERIADSYGDRTVTLLRVSTDGYSVLVGDTAAGLLDALQVRRPAGQEFDAEAFSIDLSLERLADLEDADTIFVYTDGVAEASRAELEDSPLWATLPAVRNDRAFFVPGPVWSIGVDIVAVNLMMDELERRLVEQSEASASPSAPPFTPSTPTPPTGD